MIPINTRQSKEIEFDFSVAGVDPQDIRGALRMTIEGVEYGFPVSIQEGKVIISIPPLDTIVVEDSLREGKHVPVRVELVAGDTHLVPWQDTFKIEVPIRVEAKMIEQHDKEVVDPLKIEMKLVREVDGDEVLTKKQKDKLPDKIKKKIVKKKTKLAERLG